MYGNKKEKTPFRQRVAYWVRTHKKLAIALAILVVLVIGGGVATALYFLNKSEPTVTSTTKKEEAKPVIHYSPLTGAKVDTEDVTKQAVTAIMLENSPDARPQSGLKDSGVVFEAVAEGGITRFLALYQEQKPELVGPVRSLRMYYVDWLTPFNASVAHVGGSAAALAQVRNGTYRDIDQFFNAGTYWRATDRYAPHNVYTSFERLDELNKAKGFTESTFTGFVRKDSTPAEVPAATNINVSISSALYNSSYTYDAASNTYLRSQGGAPHTDREAGQIAPRTVVVMKAPMQLVMEDGYREQITTTGSGQAYIFQDGTVQEVTWNKADKGTQITFTDAAGANVALARGQTWITAVSNTSGGVTWQ